MGSPPYRSTPSLLLFLPVFLILAAALSSCAAQSGDFLTGHNAARTEVGVPSLSWDPVVAAYALNFSSIQRDNNRCAEMLHSHGPYGENLFWGSAGKAWTAQEALDNWVSARQYYNAASNTCAPGEQCGQYTQVVWRNTTNLGCASAVCNDNSTLVMCSYNPPGNLIGQRPF